MSTLEKVDRNKLPQHIAVIMDGNGRWAQKQNQPRVFGHKNGVESVRQITEACAEIGIPYLSLFAFSTENWGRPQEEVNALMDLLVQTIHSEIDTLHKNNIRLEAIGDLRQLPSHTYEALTQAIDETKTNDRMTLILALNYSGRWDILQATRQLTHTEPHQITEEAINLHLSTAAYPEPELMVRTSGELRISNFFLWQLAYTELYFTPLAWPEFRKEHLYEALLTYQKRERRYGKTGDQIQDLNN